MRVTLEELYRRVASLESLATSLARQLNINEATGLITLPTGGAGVQIDYYESGSGTWTKPTGATLVWCEVIGGGGGGGGGRGDSAGTNRGGGAGAGGGARSHYFLLGSATPSTLDYSVGGGGTGGAGGTSANGSAGTAGTASYIRVGASEVICWGGGGYAGNGGTTVDGSINTSTSTGGNWFGGRQGSNSLGGAAGGGNGLLVNFSNVEASPTATNLGNTSWSRRDWTDTADYDPTARLFLPAASGGDGGAANASGTGGNGEAGTKYGGGGGGGGGGTSTGGNGGDGAAGICVFITWF